MTLSLALSIIIPNAMALMLGVYIGSNTKNKLIKDRLKKAEHRGYKRGQDSFAADRVYYVNKINRMSEQLRSIASKNNE